jgi:DNA-directed RNA polymerase specialized sigma24 family protein
MADVTHILSQIEQGDPQAAEKLLPLVYDELRKLAAVKLAKENPAQTLQATALVHEAYLRLVGPNGRQSAAPAGEGEAPAEPAQWNSRGHFFAAAAEAMRRILIEAARAKGRAKRGGNWQQVNLEDLDLLSSVTPDQLLSLDEAIERLTSEDPVAAKLVKLKYFAGLELSQAAHSIGVPLSTAYRHWAYGRAWLRCELLRE